LGILAAIGANGGCDSRLESASQARWFCWTLTDRVERPMPGVHENYSQNDGYHGECYSLYDASTDRWHQTGVTNRGELLLLDGGLHKANTVLTRVQKTKNGKSSLLRGVWIRFPLRPRCPVESTVGLHDLAGSIAASGCIRCAASMLSNRSRSAPFRRVVRVHARFGRERGVAESPRGKTKLGSGEEWRCHGTS